MGDFLPTQTAITAAARLAAGAGGWVRRRAEGLPSAEHAAVFLFDYTCGECRHLRRLLVPAVTGFAGRLAVRRVPVPLDPACNSAVTAASTDRRDACGYPRLAWAMWRSDPVAYASFDDWVSGSPCAPPLGEALAVARGMAPGARLAAGEPDATADARPADTAAIYRALGGRSRPRDAVSPGIVGWIAKPAATHTRPLPRLVITYIF